MGSVSIETTVRSPVMASLNVNVSELLELAAMLIFVGALAGFPGRLFGVGGGAILVPVLYELFRITGVPDETRMPLCVGTSLAIIIPTAVRSYVAHRRHGSVDMNILRKWALPILIGVVLGSVIARYAPERVFKYVFVGVAWSATIRLIFGNDRWQIAEDLPKGPLMRIYGLLIGVLSTLMGIGGGLFSNLLMTLYGRTIHQSVATSSGLAGTDFDSGHDRLYVCGMAGCREISRDTCPAIPVCDRVHLVDRGSACHAVESAHRAAGCESRTCDVEAEA